VVREHKKKLRFEVWVEVFEVFFEPRISNFEFLKVSW
jgi:hypothetical protein